MRRISSAVFLREASRLGSVVAQSPILDVTGIDLHEPGDRLGPLEIASVRDIPLDDLYVVEPGEDRRAARKGQGVEEFPVDALPLPSVLAENLMRPTGQLILRAGTILQAADRERLKAEKIGGVAVRTDVDGPGVRRARSYLDRSPAPPPRISRPQPRAEESPVWPPFLPLARVLVAMRDDMVRLRLINQFLSAGYDPVAIRDESELRDRAGRERFDVVVADLEAVATASGIVRESALMKTAAVVACHTGATGGAVARAIQAGANAVLELPARLERIVEAGWACLRLQGKKFGVPPAVLRERRAGARERGVAECRLRDPIHPKASPVAVAALAGFSDRGVGIEYGLLEAVRYDHYVVHGVHPRHPLYPYARGNPGARELLLTLAKPGMAPLEVAVQVVHVGPSLQADVAGLVLVKGPSPEMVKMLAPVRV